MFKFIPKTHPTASKYIDTALTKHINNYGIRPQIECHRDVVINDAMDLIGRLCSSKDQEISSLRKEQIHSVRRRSLLLGPPELNDLV